MDNLGTRLNNWGKGTRGPKPMDIRERFERFLIAVPETGCFLWMGQTMKNGYGKFKIRPCKDSKLAHRVAWELKHGPIPDGFDALHKCDTPGCANDYHLFLGTDADNHADSCRKGRKGKKLNNADIVAIREDPRPLKDVAMTHEVTTTLISQIKRRKIWRHVA